jgi:murein DD-endopeptidase MepM/ murein hydrolase activator NlpD
MRPLSGADPGIVLPARRLWRAERPRARRFSIPGVVLLWVVAAFPTPRTALALGVAVGGPVGGPGTAAIVGPPSQPPFVGQLSRATRVPPLRPPVVGPLVRGYEAPVEPYGPGHRGVDFAAAPGAAVWAPAAGRVVFAGGVAGTAWASIEIAAGVVATVGPLRALAVSRGRRVAMGARVAELAPGHSGGGRATTLHLGLRVDGVYVDPLAWLSGLGPPRLAPLREPGGPH